MSDPGVQRSLILTRLIFYVVFHRVSVAESGTKSKLQVYYCRAAYVDQRLFGGGVVEFYPVVAALGAEVQGIDLGGPITDLEVDALHEGLTEHKVLFFRDQRLEPKALLELGLCLGDVDPGHPVYPHAPGLPSVVELISDGDHPPDTDDWHKDLTFKPEPPFASILGAVSVPLVGGDTLWANMSAVYDDLSAGWKSDLEQLFAVHDMGTFRNDYYRAGGISAVNQALSEVGSAAHKLVETHPISGLKYLNVNQAFTRHILDLNQGQSDEILQYLFQQVKRPEFQVRLRWRDNTIAIWDNRITQHYAVCDYLPKRRHMQRVTVTRDRRE
jgi:taurine dioxygenase